MATTSVNNKSGAVYEARTYGSVRGMVLQLAAAALPYSIFLGWGKGIGRLRQHQHKEKC